MISETAIRQKLEELRGQYNSSNDYSTRDDLWHQICLLCWVIGDLHPQFVIGGD